MDGLAEGDQVIVGGGDGRRQRIAARSAVDLSDAPASCDGPSLESLASSEKTYRMGDVAVRALRGVIAHHRTRGEFVAVMGAIGLRQVHLHEHHRAASTGPPAAPTCSTGRTWPSSRATSSRRPAQPQIGFVFQGFNLLPRTTALENVELPLLYAGRRRARAPRGARRRRWPRWAWATALRPHARAALRRPAAAGGHRPRAGQPSRRCSSPTSPPATSTRAPAIEVMGIFQDLNDAGPHRPPGHARARHRRVTPGGW